MQFDAQLYNDEIQKGADMKLEYIRQHNDQTDEWRPARN
jgi:hypothetical protein